MSLIIQTVFANLIDWLFKPLDNLCSQLLTGAFSGLVGSMSNDEWNVAITAANRIGWIMGFVNMALCVIGALQARFETTIANLNTSSENMSASRGRIQDADFAAETANLSRTQILQQAGTAMVAQANQLPQGVLALLR